MHCTGKIKRENTLLVRPFHNLCALLFGRSTNSRIFFFAFLAVIIVLLYHSNNTAVFLQCKFYIHIFKSMYIFLLFSSSFIGLNNQLCIYTLCVNTFFFREKSITESSNHFGIFLCCHPKPNFSKNIENFDKLPRLRLSKALYQAWIFSFLKKVLKHFFFLLQILQYTFF